MGNKLLSHTHAKYDPVNNRTFFHKKFFKYVLLIFLEKGIREKELIEDNSGYVAFFLLLFVWLLFLCDCGFFSDLDFFLMIILLT